MISGPTGEQLGALCLQRIPWPYDENEMVDALFDPWAISSTVGFSVLVENIWALKQFGAWCLIRNPGLCGAP